MMELALAVISLPQGDLGLKVNSAGYLKIKPKNEIEVYPTPLASKMPYRISVSGN